jgi:hypothetical protein
LLNSVRIGFLLLQARCFTQRAPQAGWANKRTPGFRFVFSELFDAGCGPIAGSPCERSNAANLRMPVLPINSSLHCGARVRTPGVQLAIKSEFQSFRLPAPIHIPGP